MRNSAGSAGNALRRCADGKLTGPVEDVIAWAWREELPKVPKMSGPGGMMGGWDKTGRFGEYLSLVDLYGVNDYGAVPDFSADRWPCMDAKLIGNAVLELDDCILTMPEDWRPAPELDQFGGLGTKAVSDAWRRMTRDDGKSGLTLRLRPSELVIRHAILGSQHHDLELTDVEQRYEAYSNGKVKWFVRRVVDTVIGSNPDGTDRTMPETVEWNGWNSKQQRPMPGAYRKPFLDPDPVNIIVARAEHEIWLSALATIYEAVSARLADVVMLPPRISATPWIDSARPARILLDLKAEALREADEKAARQAAFARRFPRWFKALQRLSIDAA